MDDDEWLEIVGSRGWVVVSHDAKWHTEPPAVAAIEQHNVKCFYLYGSQSLMFFKIKALAQNWERISDKIKNENGPFIFRVSRANRLSKLL
jgi:hypothetical protein